MLGPAPGTSLGMEGEEGRVPSERRGSAQTQGSFGEWDNQSTDWSRQSTSSLGPSTLPTEFNPRRRGSALSTSSSIAGPYTLHQHPLHNRSSLSSFASSSGSPLATASTFSAGGTTIGDLSTASMPLLPGGPAGSDTSSVHSYPPWPRNRASSSVDAHDAPDLTSPAPVDRVRSKPVSLRHSAPPQP